MNDRILFEWNNDQGKVISVVQAPPFVNVSGLYNKCFSTIAQAKTMMQAIGIDYTAIEDYENNL